MDWDDLRFFDPHDDVRQTENRLPHWQQTGAVYFVTFHLADSLPARLIHRWADEREAWLRCHPKPWTHEIEMEFHERFSGAIERWLDAGHGACILRDPACRRIATHTLSHFEGERCSHIAWVVMPNHVHLLFVSHPDWAIEKLLRSWKTFSARRINETLGRSGSLWHRDYFDRLIRDRKHFANCVRYIRRNPTKAGLREGEYDHWENELACGIE